MELGSSCRVSVDSIEFDLSTLTRNYPLTWTDRYTGVSYDATVCNSASLLSRRCPMVDAVATESNTCKVYGIYSALELTEYLIPEDPKAGVVLTYGGGGLCHSATTSKQSATFMIACDMNLPDPNGELYKVESSVDDCQHIFYFRGPAGCGSEADESSGGDKQSTGGWSIFGYILLAVTLYCCVGMAYNMRTEGSEGIDSIPHIELIRSACSSFSTGMSEAVEQASPALASAGSTGARMANQSISAISRSVAKAADKYVPPSLGDQIKAAVPTSAPWGPKKPTANYTALYDKSVAEAAEAQAPLQGVEENEEGETTVSFGTDV